MFDKSDLESEGELRRVRKWLTRLERQIEQYDAESGTLNILILTIRFEASQDGGMSQASREQLNEFFARLHWIAKRQKLLQVLHARWYNQLCELTVRLHPVQALPGLTGDFAGQPA
jgi:hypothetical protein